MPDPNSSKLLLTQDTMFPSASAAESTMVSPGADIFAGAAGVDARDGFTLPHNDAAYSRESSLASGTLTKFGSALNWNRSAYASFLASTNKCQYFGFLGPREANVSPGAHCGRQAWSTLSISFAAQACEGGGNSRMSKPWYWVRAGSTHSPLYWARSSRVMVPPRACDLATMAWAISPL